MPSMEPGSPTSLSEPSTGHFENGKEDPGTVPRRRQQGCLERTTGISDHQMLCYTFKIDNLDCFQCNSSLNNPQCPYSIHLQPRSGSLFHPADRREDTLPANRQIMVDAGLHNQQHWYTAMAVLQRTREPIFLANRDAF